MKLERGPPFQNPERPPRKVPVGRGDPAAKNVQVVRALSMMVVSDGTNPGATARGDMFGVEMCG
jgi:hypothetical protein